MKRSRDPNLMMILYVLWITSMAITVLVSDFESMNADLAAHNLLTFAMILCIGLFFFLWGEE